MTAFRCSKRQSTRNGSTTIYFDQSKYSTATRDSIITEYDVSSLHCLSPIFSRSRAMCHHDVENNGSSRPGIRIAESNALQKSSKINSSNKLKLFAKSRFFLVTIIMGTFILFMVIPDLIMFIYFKSIYNEIHQVRKFVG